MEIPAVPIGCTVCLNSDWYSNPVPGLVLYFPSIGRELCLNCSKITMGKGKDFDLDISEIPGLANLDQIHLVFQWNQCGWTVSNLGPLECKGGCITARLNDLPVAGYETGINKGDFLLLCEREVVVIRSVFDGAVIKPAAKKEEPLVSDMTLFWESISLTNGHAGSEVQFSMGSRVVQYRSWSSVGDKQSPPDHGELKIPESVATKEDLIRYVRSNRPGWPLWESYIAELPVREDVLLFFGEKGIVQYDGGRDSILYRKWDPDTFGPGSKFCEETLIPPKDLDKTSLIKHISRHRPKWPGSICKLDEDIILQTNGDGTEVRYVAKKRAVVRIPCQEDEGMNRHAQPEELKLADYVSTLNQLEWFVDMKKPGWLYTAALRQELMEDFLLTAPGKGGLFARPDVIYYALRHMVVLRTRGREEDALPIPYSFRTRQEVVQYVQSQKPNWFYG